MTIGCAEKPLTFDHCSRNYLSGEPGAAGWSDILNPDVIDGARRTTPAQPASCSNYKFLSNQFYYSASDLKKRTKFWVSERKLV